jgi:hypothetical protein
MWTMRQLMAETDNGINLSRGRLRDRITKKHFIGKSTQGIDRKNQHECSRLMPNLFNFE